MPRRVYCQIVGKYDIFSMCRGLDCMANIKVDMRPSRIARKSTYL